MSQNTTTAPAGPAPVAAPAPTASAPAPAAAPSAPDVKSLMGQLSPSDRLLAATGRFGEIKIATPPAPAATVVPVAPVVEAAPVTPVADVAPAAAATAEPVPATPAPAEPTPTSEESHPGSGEGSESKGKRFRFSSEDDVAVSQLAKSRGISLVDAARIYAGDAPTAQPAPVPVAVPEPVPVVDPAVTSYDTRITEAQTQITALLAKRDSASDELDRKEENKINDQIADLKVEVRMLQNEKQGHLRNVEQHSEATYQKGIDAAKDRVFSEYPQFATTDSMERLALDAYVTRAINDPKRKAEFKDTNWPEKIAREFAAKQGIKPKTAGSAPAVVIPAPVAIQPTIAKPQPQQVQTPAGAKLLTGADGQNSPSATRPLTRETMLELIKNDPVARRDIVKRLGARS